jgi:hypothetical protein
MSPFSAVTAVSTVVLLIAGEKGLSSPYKETYSIIMPTTAHGP